MRVLAIALESVGVVAIIAGITVECLMQADIGYVVISVGSVMLAAGGLMWAKLIRGRNR